MSMGAVIALFFFTIRQMLRDAKFWGVAVVLLLPCVLTLIIRRFAPPPESLNEPWQLYHGLLNFMFLTGLLPLACMIYGTALIGADAESRTIGYLITRRLKRHTVLITRFLAAALVLAVLCDAAVTALHFSILTGMDLTGLATKSPVLAAWNPQHDLTVYLKVTPLGVVGFLGIFALIGLLTARPMTMSVFYLIVFELVIGNLPAEARVYSLSHQLRATVVGAIPRLTKLFEIPPDLAARVFLPGGSGVVAVLGVTAAALVLAGILVSVRELTPAKVARD